MTTTLDLTPATAALTDLVNGVRDDQLDLPTPCPQMSVRDLLDHVSGLSLAFAAAGTKEQLPGGSQPPSVDGSRLTDDFRPLIGRRLRDLADAWKVEDAWQGMTEAGGIQMPGDIAGSVAINEVMVHGWDLAAATGQELRVDPRLVEAAFEFVRQSALQNPGGTPGLFGPPVPVPPSAPRIDQLIGLSGRNPGWQGNGAG